MIAPTGRTIPDPPEDAEQRRLWKQEYYRDLYGWSPEEIERARRYGTVLGSRRRIPRPPRWLRWITDKILAPIGAVASLVYLWEACHRL